MPNFPRVNASGWAEGDELTPEQINKLDLDHTKAPNFDEGSSHSPTGTIDVFNHTGGGFGDISVLGTLDQQGPVDITGPTVGIDGATVVTFKGLQLPQLAARGYRYPQPIEGAISNGSKWTFAAGLTTYYRGWKNSDTSGGAGKLVVPLTKLPLGGDITQVKLWIDGKGGGPTHTNRPATKPAITLKAQNIDTGVVSDVSTTTDNPANVGAYDSYHAITITLGDGVAPIDQDTQYILEVTGEASTDAVNDALAVLCCSVLVTAKQLAP